MSTSRHYRREKTAVRIAQDIVKGIRLDGHADGVRLPPERDMIEKYGVGRGTLREALRYLELQGVLDIKPGPGGGPIVKSPDSGNLQNTLALLLEFSSAQFRTIAEGRLALEPMVARLAAERINEEQLGELASSVQVMEKRVDDQAVFLEENRRFHDIIAWSSGNALFGHLIESMVGISDGAAFGTDYPPHRRRSIVAAHRTILESIESKDPDASHSAMSDHIRAFVTYIEKKYPSVMEMPITWDRFTG